MEGYHNLKVNTREIIAYEKLKKPEVVTGRFRGREKVKLYEQLVESFRVDVPSGELLMTFNFDEYNQHY